ncbi:hypothetical protein Droror1_Dr00020655 [Drosera rotundifolia]
MFSPPFAIQGAHLMATGHHYVSAAGEKSRQMYSVVEKMFWKKNPTKDWVEADKEDIQDELWHKAGHPINMTSKYRMGWTLLSCSNLGRPWLVRLHPSSGEGIDAQGCKDTADLGRQHQAVLRGIRRGSWTALS